jgi:hypothetical protein
MLCLNFQRGPWLTWQATAAIRIPKAVSKHKPGIVVANVAGDTKIKKVEKRVDDPGRPDDPILAVVHGIPGNHRTYRGGPGTLSWVLGTTHRDIGFMERSLLRNRGPRYP